MKLFMRRRFRPIDADAFVIEWNAKARQPEHPTDRTTCLLCGSDQFPHEHSQGQINDRRAHIAAHNVAKLPLR